MASDQSDIAQRIESLTQQLNQRKAEASALRRQQRQQHKMKLKAKEDSLRQQIEVKIDGYCHMFLVFSASQKTLIPAVTFQARDETCLKA